MSKTPSLSFEGFSAKERFTSIPEGFFHTLLNQIDDLNELKVILYALWLVAHKEGASHPLWEQEFLEGVDAEDIKLGLEKCVRRGSLLKVASETGEAVYFINSPRGRAAAEAVRESGLLPSKKISAPPLERLNIYQLYEENIGPLTPMIADTLKDAEQEYPAKWIEEAFELAVKANARNWRYAEAILKRWKEEGYGKKQNRKDSQEDRKRYRKDKYADYFD